MSKQSHYVVITTIFIFQYNIDARACVCEPIKSTKEVIIIIESLKKIGLQIVYIMIVLMLCHIVIKYVIYVMLMFHEIHFTSRYQRTDKNSKNSHSKYGWVNDFQSWKHNTP